MTVNTVSLGSPFRWLAEAFAMCRAHTRVLFGAASMLLFVAALPSVAQMLVEAALQPSAGTRGLIQAVFTLIALLAFPPVVGGFYRLVHALHEGRPAHARDLFALFQDGPAAIRLIVTNLIFVAVSLLVIVGLAAVVGGEELFEFLRAAAVLKPGATELPPVPDGMLILISVLSILGLVIMTAQGLATAEVAVTGRAPLAAAAAGFKLALRNLGTLLLFYLPVAVIAFIVFMILALVAALVGGMLSLVSPALAAVLLLPLALLFVLVVYALMFTFFYHAWRDTLGAGGEAPPEHQIAV